MKEIFNKLMLFLIRFIAKLLFRLTDINADLSVEHGRLNKKILNLISGMDGYGYAISNEELREYFKIRHRNDFNRIKSYFNLILQLLLAFVADRMFYLLARNLNDKILISTGIDSETGRINFGIKISTGIDSETGRINFGIKDLYRSR